MTRKNSFRARASTGLQRLHVSSPSGNDPAPPRRLLCCRHVVEAGPDVTGRGGTAQAQKRGRGTRLVVLLPENRRQSSCGHSFSSRPTMSSHLVEQPPPPHNNNNNCEEGEQPLPPPAGLNSECGAGGLGEGDGGGGAALAAAASSAREGTRAEGSPLVQAGDVRVTDGSRQLSRECFCLPLGPSPLPSGVLGRGLFEFAVGEDRWLGREAGPADPTCAGPLSGANRGVEGRALERGEGGWAERAAEGTWAGMGTCGGDARRWTQAAGRWEGAAEGQAGGQVCGLVWPGPADLTSLGQPLSGARNVSALVAFFCYHRLVRKIIW